MIEEVICGLKQFSECDPCAIWVLKIKCWQLTQETQDLLGFGF